MRHMHNTITKILGVGSWAVLVLFAMVACSAIEKRTWINTGCEMECETCNGVKLRCDNETGQNADSEAQGTLSGPSTN